MKLTPNPRRGGTAPRGGVNLLIALLIGIAGLVWLRVAFDLFTFAR